MLICSKEKQVSKEGLNEGENEARRERKPTKIVCYTGLKSSSSTVLWKKVLERKIMETGNIEVRSEGESG